MADTSSRSSACTSEDHPRRRVARIGPRSSFNDSNRSDAAATECEVGEKIADVDGFELANEIGAEAARHAGKLARQGSET